MSLTAFISRHRRQYDKNEMLEDLSSSQRVEFLKSALTEWSEVWPRTAIGAIRFKKGSRIGLLPFDYLSSYGGVNREGYRQVGEGISVKSSSLHSFSSLLAATSFPTSTWSYQTPRVRPTTDERGRNILILEREASSDEEVDIVYKALHRIEDSGYKIKVSKLPAQSESIRVNTVDYSFKQLAQDSRDIEIASSLEEMADRIADKLMMEDIALARSEADEVEIRSSRLEAISVEASHTSLLVQYLPAVNTLAIADQQHVFSLLMEKALSARAYKHIAAGEIEASKQWTALAKAERDRVTPFLINPGMTG